MQIHQKIVLGLVLLLSTSLVGCKGKLKDLVKQAEKELGVKVELFADNRDQCAKEQLKGLLKEYGHLSKSDRNAFKAEIKSKYDQINLIGTSLSGSAVSERVILSYQETIPGACRIFPQDCEASYGYTESKVLKDSNQLIGGEYPVALLRKDAHELTIQSQKLEQDVRQINAYTWNRYVFYDINSHEQLTDARYNGYIFSNEDHYTDTRCAPPLSLRDLL